MSCTLFPQYQPTEPVTYDARVNIFTGTLFPELLDGPAVDVDQVAEYHRVHRAVLVELLEDFAHPKAAHLMLFDRFFTDRGPCTEPNATPGTHFAKCRRGFNYQGWTSVWGYVTHVSYDRQANAPVYYAHRNHTHIGRAEKMHPVLQLITAVVSANQVRPGKKRPNGTKQYIRKLLQRRGIATGPAKATREQLCSTWRQW